MWGQALYQFVRLVPNRIIPTRVGTSSISSSPISSIRDHPHACGDKLKFQQVQHLSMGSSPRVWGQGKTATLSLLSPRIIPTRVGTSSLWRKKKPIYEDHPHACGDKAVTAIGGVLLPGSSPRVWGQETEKWVEQNINRIIPTRVGTRCLNGIDKDGKQDHPHACGDKVFCPVCGRGGLGSSPRVWGQAD